MDKYLPLKIQKSIGKNIQAIFEGKATILEKYYGYEDAFLKEANKGILADNGQPDVMNQMNKDFVRTLQNALVIKDYDPLSKRSSSQMDMEDHIVSGSQKVSKEKTSDKNVVARDKDGVDVYINLFDFIKDEMKITDREGDQINGSTKLYPDFDFS